MSKSTHSHIKEVHRSKEHGRKSWSTYIFEFFMLFLAVFCGFLAEYYLEYRIERNREKEFIVSMVKELKADSIKLITIQKDSSRYKMIDSLALMILNDKYSTLQMKRIYDLFLNKYTSYVEDMQFSRNTLSQLKFAGNMRLIRNKSVIDSLNKLDNKITEILGQHNSYVNYYMVESSKLSYKIFDLRLMVKNGKWISKNEFSQQPDKLHFLLTDKSILMEYGNMLHGQSRVLKLYHVLLEDYRNLAVNLIQFLEKEYHLKNE